MLLYYNQVKEAHTDSLDSSVLASIAVILSSQFIAPHRADPGGAPLHRMRFIKLLICITADTASIVTRISHLQLTIQPS